MCLDPVSSNSKNSEFQNFEFNGCAHQTVWQFLVSLSLSISVVRRQLVQCRLKGSHWMLYTRFQSIEKF